MNGSTALKTRTCTREQLLHLLAEASEMEHNLLCCYLFAAFSLKRAPIDSLHEDESRAIESWRKSIMSVAVEEMAHLAIVANLAVSIGARPHFNRPNLPVAPGYHPAGIVVKLAPFNMATLDHFIFLERPDGVALPDGEGFESEVVYARSSRRGALMPHAPDYETIAEFYKNIRDGFISLAGELGESKLFCGDAGMQVGPDVVSIPGLAAVTGLESALLAIDTIIVQGEGSGADAQNSHFARFCAIKVEYTRLMTERPGFAPARPVATDPLMRRPITADDRTYVESRPAADVLDIANALYNLLLRLLGQAYARGPEAPGAKRVLMDAAMTVMHVFGTTAEYLTTLPAGDDAPGINAGVTFTVLRATESLLEGKGEWAVIGERVDEIARRMRAVSAEAPALQPGLQQLEKLSRVFSVIPAA
jgi:hypothetical protein